MATTTTTIGGDAAAQAATTAATSSAAKTTGAEGFGMDKDAFLKILVEQLRHQDPSQPGDSQQYIQQMTQFSMLEQMTNISESSQQQIAADTAAQAINLVGRTVTYLAEGEGDEPVEKTGVVDGVDFSSGAPSLTVGGQKDVPLGSITEVR